MITFVEIYSRTKIFYATLKLGVPLNFVPLPSKPRFSAKTYSKSSQIDSKHFYSCSSYTKTIFQSKKRKFEKIFFSSIFYPQIFQKPPKKTPKKIFLALETTRNRFPGRKNPLYTQNNSIWRCF
jgi:hypothetical protein